MSRPRTPECIHSLHANRNDESPSVNERGGLLLDHVIITVKDLDRSIAFYQTALKPLGIVHASITTARMAPKDIPTSRASDGTAAYSSGSGMAMRTPRLRISALSPKARLR